jgi:DNA-binding NtrC family response regulator
MMNNICQKSILVVDDDARWLRALDKVLTGEGAVVFRAQWAGDVLELLTARKLQFDLLITDLRMPFVTGLTLVYSVRKMFPTLPIIVLTAFGSPDVKAECLNQGTAAFLEKPLDTAALLNVIQGVLASPPGIKTATN